MINSIDINSQDPDNMLNYIGKIIDESFDKKDIITLNEVIKISNTICIDNLNSKQKAIYYFFMSNSWRYLEKLNNNSEKYTFDNEVIEAQIRYLRLAIILSKEIEDKLKIAYIYTNLGNLFFRIGRFIEAQEYYDIALEYNNNFGMALGNKGNGLFHYARVVFDHVHQFIFLQYARKYLKESLNSDDVYSEASDGFNDILRKIEEQFDIDILDDYKQYQDHYKGLSKRELNYRIWCAQNRLFLNPLNDVMKQSVVSYDYLHTPTMIIKIGKKPIYHALFNQIKQEFASARYLFFDAKPPKKPHLSDKGVILMDTLDNSVYSFAMEKVKIAFRVSYSILDKIAFFINEYFGLNIDGNKVTFRSIWYINGKRDKGLNLELLNKQNWALLGLFWLSKDLEENDFSSPIEPNAKELVTIRNFIEHKAFCVVNSKNSDYSKLSNSFKIDRNFFNEKTLKVLKLIRSAIMYLTFAIYQEESTRPRGHNKLENIDFKEIDNKYRK